MFHVPGMFRCIGVRPRNNPPGTPVLGSRDFFEVNHLFPGTAYKIKSIFRLFAKHPFYYSCTKVGSFEDQVSGFHSLLKLGL